MGSEFLEAPEPPVPKKDELTLYPFGDVELWYAEPADKSWQLPFNIRWHKETITSVGYALIVPAVCLYQNQHLTVQALLQQHSLEDRSDRWLIPRKLVHALLFKADGITPTYYYRWSGNHPVMPIALGTVNMRFRAPPELRSPTFDSLARFVAHERHLPADVVNTVLTALGSVAAKWMVEFRQPMDLGFCRLVALPFRANWKQIVAFKSRRIGLRTLFSRLRGSKRRAALSEVGFENLVTSPHNVALRRSLAASEVLDHIIEAVPSDKFESAVGTIEAKRLRAGSTAYVRHFEETVEMLYEHIIDALHSYLQKVAKPFAAVCERGESGQLGFVPIEKDKAVIRGVSLANLPVHIVPPDSRFSVFAAESDPRLVHPAPLALPEVSDIQPEDDDVRDGDVGPYVG